MNNLSPELQESIEQLKAAARSVNRPYQGRTRSARLEAAQAEPATPVAASVPTPEVPPVSSQRESEACARQRVRSQRGG